MRSASANDARISTNKCRTIVPPPTLDADRTWRYIGNAGEWKAGALCLQIVTMRNTDDRRAWHANRLRAVILRAAGGGRFIAYCLGVLGLAFVTVQSASAATPIYKCFDRKSDVVYTDQPCKDGAPLDVRAGEADPAAVARLERTRESLDQSAAERIRDMRLMSVQPAFAPQFYPGPYGQGAPDYSAYDYGPLWGLSGLGTTGFGHRHPQHRRSRAAFNARGFAVTGPHMGGRR